MLADRAGGAEGRDLDFIKLAVSLLVCLLAGFLGSILTAPAIPEWYQALEKPSFTPPAWLFAPVWTLLFIM
ncbi:MAG TPA: tryptophan-rich sensory protein, partial [Candidatus Methanoperedenaceae archaeon]|nr:tryptophan-rich sensory protein [Candidatus Methanoperedenaceae archaeon]